MLAAIAVVVAGVGVYFGVLRSPDYHEHISGPSGDYPNALGSAPPVNPTRAVGHGETDLVQDGLRIAVDETVRAFNIRSGKEFWAYQRDDVVATDATAADGSLYVLWSDGLLVRFDPKAADVIWHRETDAESADLYVVEDTVIAASGGTASGFATKDGDDEWDTTFPNGCTRTSPQHAVTSGHLTLHVRCGDADAALILRNDGEVRWSAGKEVSGVFPMDAERAVILEGNALIYSIADVEADRAVPTPSGGRYVGATPETLISWAPNGHGKGTTVLAGYGLERNDIAWRVTTDGTWRLSGAPYVAGDFVYTVQVAAAKQRMLVVYHAETGEEQSRTKIDLTDVVKVPDYAYDDVEVTVAAVSDGVVVVNVDTQRGQVLPSGDDLLFAAD